MQEGGAMKIIEVSSNEYAALKNLEEMIRLAMTTPNTGEFVAVALQALDAVRRDESMETAALLRSKSDASDLVLKLMDRIEKP
jgi:hypothetical protein